MSRRLRKILTRCVAVVGAVVAATSVCAQPTGTNAGEIERREFTFDAPRGRAFRWTSEPVMDGDRKVREGLNYTWSLPMDFDEGKAYDLLIVVHPVGKDCRWAPTALDRGAIGNRIVIAPDGTSAITQGVRSFRADDNDMLVFREFVLEMTRSFPGDRIFLYGYEQGGGFALGFAGLFPSLAEGVIVHAGEVWEGSAKRGGIAQVPIVFLHGTADEKTPYRRVVSAYEEYDEHEMRWLRPLHGKGHAPDAAAVAQGVDWCTGMVSDKADDVLAAGLRLLRGRGEAGGAAPGFGAAMQVLRRLLGESESNPAHEPLEEVPENVRAEAKAWIDAIELHAALHVMRIQREAGSESEMVLNGKPWLGHLVALREDFRGVRAVEDFVLKSGFERIQRWHSLKADELMEAWELKDERERFEGVIRVLPRAFMIEGFSPGFYEKMRASKERVVELKLSEESLEGYENVTLLKQAREEGMARYRETLRAWREPK